MNQKCVAILMILAFSLVVPAAAAESKHGLGGALVSGVLDCDTCVDAFEFGGFALFGKIGFTENWGLLITYRDMEDNEDFFMDEEDTYTQIAVQGVYMWRPAKPFRPHIKFGLERTEFEAEIPGVTKVSDDGTAFAVGGGFEAGSQRVAFFLDYDFTIVELELYGQNEDFDIGNLDLGIIFKF